MAQLPWSAPGLGQSVTKSPLAGLVLAKCYNSSATNAIKQSRCIVTIGESTEMVGARVAAVRWWLDGKERAAGVCFDVMRRALLNDDRHVHTC